MRIILIFSHHPPPTTLPKFHTGLKKLDTTANSVEVMQVELEDLQPELVATTKEVDEMMVVVERKLFRKWLF